MARLSKQQLQALQVVKLAEKDELQQVLMEQKREQDQKAAELQQLNAQKQRVGLAAQLSGEQSPVAQVTRGMAIQYLRQLEHQAGEVMEQVRQATAACDETVAKLQLAIGELDVLKNHGKQLRAHHHAEQARLNQVETDDAWLVRRSEGAT